MIRLDIRSDIARAQKKLAQLSANLQSKAVVRAINKTAAQTKVESSREIRGAGYNLKAKTIKAGVTISKATPKNQQAVVKAVGKRLNLINYNARQVANGVSVRVKGQKTVLLHAFLAKMPNGHIGVYERIQGLPARRVGYEKDGKKNNKVLPIRSVDGPSIPQAFAEETVNKALHKGIAERFPRLLDHEITYLLKTS